jgi:hypothetical protein
MPREVEAFINLWGHALRDILFQPVWSLATTLLAFAFMPWPGYLVLHIAGWGRGRIALPLLFAPAVTLALFVVGLSGSAWSSIPLAQVATPMLIASAVTGIAGLVLYFSDRGPTFQAAYIFLAGIIALALTPSIFRYGIGYFVGSICLDGWSYVAVAEYLTHVPRGVDSGLSSLHQYGSHLMQIRNASSSLLADLAVLFETKADEVVSLYSAVIVFANACALTAFASVVFKRADLIAAYVILAGIAVPGFIISYANLDQLLVLPLLTLTAAIAASAGHRSKLGGGLLLGLLMAASVLAYVEMALLGLLVAMSFAMSPGERLQPLVLRMTLPLAIALPVAALLASPGIAPLFAMLNSQYASANQPGIRPGEGMLANWIMRGDFLRLWWIYIPIAVAASLSFITVAGIFVERRRWGALISFAVVSILTAHFLLNERYLYAVYKIVTINFWMYCFFTVAGGAHLISKAYIGRRTLKVGAPALALITIAAIGVGAFLDRRQAPTAQLHASYREAITISEIVASAPLQLSVMDHIANQWAVLYLSGSPMIISPYRSTMSQAHVIPVMDRAKPVPHNEVRYIVTDRDEGIRSQMTGVSKVWEGQLYSLWGVETDNWTVASRESSDPAVASVSRP